MPLIKGDLKQKLKSSINNLEPQLKNILDDRSNGIYDAYRKIDQLIEAKQISSGFNIEEFKRESWEIFSDELSKSLAKQITKYLAEEISDVISTEITDYIKTSQIIVPLPTGAVTATIT